MPHTKKFIHHQSARYITQPQGIRRRRIQPVISIITLVMITIKLVLPTGFRKFLVHNIKELEIGYNFQFKKNREWSPLDFLIYSNMGMETMIILCTLKNHQQQIKSNE
uniref:Uncharacterized protein n=1 Tax=Erpetoichthys calabaricus TaxID=27687 RepID=A0A8C4RQN7_ERPCA